MAKICELSFEIHQTFKILSSLNKKHTGANRYTKNKEQIARELECNIQISSINQDMAFSYFLNRAKETLPRITNPKASKLQTENHSLNTVLQQQSNE